VSQAWMRTTLGTAARIKQGRYLPKDNMADAHSKISPIPVHGANGIIGWTSKPLYTHGVPLVTCRGSNCGMVLWADGPLWVSNNAMAVLPGADLDLRFLYFNLLNSPPYKFVSGSAQPQITMGDLSKKAVTLPPLPEQRAIATTLGALDDKIELNRRMNGTLEAMARALFRDWFVDFGPTRSKMAGDAPNLSPDLWALFPDSLDDNGKPEGWKVSTIGDEVRIVGGSTPSTKEPEFWDGGINWATPKDLSKLAAPVLLETSRTITEAGLAKISSGLLPVGAVLLSSRAPIGYLAIAETPVAINQGFIGMICDKRVSNVFAWLWTLENMEAIHAMANGSTFQEINKRNFRPLPVVVPPEPILRAFDAVATPLYERIAENERQSRTLAQTRDLLLPRLMSGQIRIQPEIMAL
jgi:type I restriction enzyme S subunit